MDLKRCVLGGGVIFLFNCGNILHLIDRVTDELWNEVRDIVQETGIKTIPKKKNAKMQNGSLRRPYK